MLLMLEKTFWAQAEIHGVNVNSNILTFETVFFWSVSKAEQRQQTEEENEMEKKITWSIKYLWNNFSIFVEVSMIMSGAILHVFQSKFYSR